jgi:uncharacterized repeat protein (TIGR01451 family)
MKHLGSFSGKLILVLVLLCSAAAAETITENFDQDPGWRAHGLPSNTSDFGFRNSSLAGGDPGEIGGYFSSTDRLLWYGDDNIGTFSGDDMLSASGLLNIAEVDEGYNNTVFVGHFDGSQTSALRGIGFEILEDISGSQSIDNPRFRINYRIGEAEGLLFTIANTQETRSWSYLYDPKGGDHGSLTVSVSGTNGDSATVFLTAQERSSLTAQNTFGLANNAQELLQTQRLALYIDNVIYSQGAPPEEYPDLVLNKTVDNPSPLGDELVEFTLEVSNQGRGEANGVKVFEQLPGDMEIPEGMAAAPSVGTYKPASGEWEIGILEPGQTETMRLPARIHAVPQPVCVINRADVASDIDEAADANAAWVALRRPDVERCVDLGVEVMDWAQVCYACGGDTIIEYRLRVRNAGPDAARNVVLEISETSYRALGFRTDATHCNALRCVWPELAGDSEVIVTVQSDRFQIQTSTEHGIAAAVSSDVEDYAAGNNSLTYRSAMRVCTSPSCQTPDWNINVGSGAGGCMIATAAYGTVTDERLNILRRFRDDVLLRSASGQALVDWYYRVSPPIAAYIAPRPLLRAIVRALLAPLLLLISYPLPVAAALGIVVAGGVIVRRRWRVDVHTRSA